MIDSERAIAAVRTPSQPTRLTAADWLSAAIHEVGHAAGADAAGFRVQFIELGIAPEPAYNGSRMGRCRLRLTEFPATWAFRYPYAVYGLAGSVAEWMLTETPPKRPDASDVALAMQDAQVLYPGDQQRQVRFYIVAGRKAAEIVHQYRRQIIETARLLVLHGRLEGRDVHHLLRS